jgi:hypothetical protein
MNRLLFRLALVLVIFSGSSVISHAQSFKEGDFVIDLGANFSDYTATSLSSAPGSVTKTDKITGGVYSGGLEYGLFNWLGIGVKVRYDDYITSKDSITHFSPSRTGYDVILNANLHVIKTKHLDIPLGVGYGYSGLNYNIPTDTLVSTLKGKGAIFDVHVDPRIYFGNHFGINFHLAYTYFGYPQLVYADNKNGSSPNTTHLTATGINLGVGLQFKF